MDWELAERSKKCLSCGKDFKEGDHYKTALVYDDEKIKELVPPEKIQKEAPQKPQNPFCNTAQRLEFCPSCWEEKVREKPHDCKWEGAVSYPAETKKHVHKFNKEETFALFKEYMGKSGQTDDERVEINGICYFLALMLERKNLLVQKEDFLDEASGARSALYVEPKTGEEHKIKYPLLSRETMDHYNQIISELLGLSASPAKAKDEISKPTVQDGQANPGSQAT